MFNTLASLAWLQLLFAHVVSSRFTFVHATELTQYLHVNVHVTHSCCVRSRLALTIVTTSYLTYLTAVDTPVSNWCTYLK